MWSKENLLWLAGFLEGEGCFTTNHLASNNAIRIIATSSDGDVINKCYEIIGYGSVSGPRTSTNKLSKKPSYTWSLTSSNIAYALMVALYGFMGNRRKERILELIRVYKKSFSPQTYYCFGEVKYLREWAKDPRCRVGLRTLKSRVNCYGWIIEDALIIPKRREG